MTTDTELLTVPRVDLDLIDLHPANPRIDATADDELVESVRQQGVLDPLMIAPSATDPGRYVLIDGHRRHNAATRAGLTEVPVNPRYDLVTEAQQIEVMAITGLQKEKLSAVEEAIAYEQLTLLGMDAAAIAASTGFPARRVKDRLKLNQLTDTVRDTLHAGDATLEDAAAMLEFADDPEETARLTEAFGSHNFPYEVQAARSRRDRRTRNQALVDSFTEQGATEATAGDWRSLRSFEIDGQEKLAAAAGHKGCLGWVGDVDSYSEPYLVCTKPTKHKPKKPGAAPAEPELSDWEKQGEERAAAAAAGQAATAVRIDFLREHLRGLLPAKGNSPLAGIVKVLLPLLITDGREFIDDKVLPAAFGVDIDHADAATYYAQIADARVAVGEAATTATTAKALAGFADFVAGYLAEQVAVDATYIDTHPETVFVLGVWDWLAAAGYVLSDFDTAARAAVEARRDELAVEQTAEGDGD